MLLRLEIFNSRYTNESTKQYSTAIPEASVAVKTPVTIPPITTTNSNKLGKASKKVLSIVPKLLRSPAGYFFFLIQKVATNISASPIKIPGIYPARNNEAIETPPLASEYTINTLEGGMINPVVEAVILIAAPNSLE